jgi:hypothetical protein
MGRPVTSQYMLRKMCHLCPILFLVHGSRLSVKPSAVAQSPDRPTHGGKVDQESLFVLAQDRWIRHWASLGGLEKMIVSSVGGYRSAVTVRSCISSLLP